MKKLSNAKSDNGSYLQNSMMQLLRLNSSESFGDAYFRVCIWILCTETGTGRWSLKSFLPLTIPWLLSAAVLDTNGRAKHGSNCRASMKANCSLCSAVPSWTSARNNEYHTLLNRRDLQAWSRLGRHRICSTTLHHTVLGVHLVRCSWTLAVTWKTACRACIWVQLPRIMSVVHRENKEMN